MSQTYQVSATIEYLEDLGELSPRISSKAIKNSIQMVKNPFHRTFHPEKIQDAEPGMYSSRVDRNYRIIWKHIKPNHIVLCFIDKHDPAYRRARRTSFTLNDGVMELADVVKIEGSDQTTATDIGMFKTQSKEKAVGELFMGYKDQELLEYGVPKEVLDKVRALNNLNQLGYIERLLSEDTFNNLLSIAIGEHNRIVVPDQKLKESIERNQGGKDIYKFVDSEEFKRALEGDMEDWMLFLAPHQRRIVNREYTGPARIKGVVGSGKTVVAIHRLVHLAREAQKRDKKVLFLTYGNRLPDITYHLVQRLAGQNSPELQAIECNTIHSWCGRFLWRHNKSINIDKKRSKDALQNAIQDIRPEYPSYKIWESPNSFFRDEIRYAIKGRAISELDEYLDLDRSGRGTGLNEDERRVMFKVYTAYQENLGEQAGDYDDLINRSLELIEAGVKPTRYSTAVIDEIQDLSAAIMRLIRGIIPEGENDLFLVGDGLQRIYPGGYVLGRLDIDIVGRGTLLKKNYRNTQQILQAAHAMMENQTYDDMDNEEVDVIEPEYSVRDGDKPVLHGEPTITKEMKWVVEKIKILKEERGYEDADFAFLYRWRKPYQDEVLNHVSEAVSQLEEITGEAETYFGAAANHSTFHSSKGLEFKVVFVLGVTDTKFVPRDDWSLSGKALEEHFARERRLLYVAMTRARDLLYLTYSRGMKSRYLSDIPKEMLQLEN